MRENEGDGGDGWQQPDEQSSPWAPGDVAPGSFGPAAGAAPPPPDRGRDTISFGTPNDEAGDGQDFYVQPGDWRQPGDRREPGDWREPGYGQAEPGHAEPGQAGQWSGGSGGAGWGVPAAPPPRGRRGGRLIVYVGVAALAACVGAGATVAIGETGGPTSGISSQNVPAPHNNSPGSGSSGLNQVKVADRVKPGLVDIISTLKYDSETAEGTGMILSSTGLVLTNNHVIDGATSVVARLVDSGKRYQAQVVGYDNTDDVALLQLRDASGLATVNFGNSAQVGLGTAVLALGNAEGRGGATPAAGIINALDRSIQASDQGSGQTEYLYHMMQTNAAIQQGDSGGALANNAGQVIGMITAADTASPGTPGNTIGFAIPINSALAIASQIAAGHGSASVYIGEPGFLGVEVAQSDSPSPRQQAIDERGAAGNGGRVGGRQHGGSGACLVGSQPPVVPTTIAPTGTGVLILGILCGTAADSRLAPGDVITSVDGRAVTTPGSLTGITAMYHPGQVVSVGWVGLGGEKHTTSIRLGNGPAR
jgi:S1-C subfamily serine protease